jgi:putative ABC transport system permease protein
MNNLLKDIRFAARSLTKHPGFTLVTVITLALGIAVNTAIFTVVDGVMLRPLNFPEPERLMVVNEVNLQQSVNPFELSYLNWLDVQQRSRSFEQFAGIEFTGFMLKLNGLSSRVSAIRVSSNLFPLLRANAAQGRTLLPEDDQPGTQRVAVVSHAFWQRYFPNQTLSGQAVTLDNESVAIVGVMASDFQFPDDKMEVFVPLSTNTGANMYRDRSVHMVFGLGRLKAGVSQSQAANDLATVFAGIEAAHPGEDPGHSASLTPLHERITANVKPALYVLLGAVLFVLLIACANVANLQLARTLSRGREMAVRVALGASRWRVVRQSLVESLLLSLVGGALGLLMAIWIVSWLLSHVPEGFPRLSEIGINKTVLFFTASVAILTGIISGLAPALQSAKTDVSEALKSGGKGRTQGESRLKRSLVVAEVALSLMLFIGAGLLIKSFWQLTKVNPGFNSDHLLTLHVSLPELKYSDDKQVINFYKELPGQLSTLPGVTSVSAVNRLPISGGDPQGDLAIDGRSFGPGESPGISFRRILPNYFRTMGIPLLQGREFDDRDTGGIPDVVIINQALAKRYWPLGDAVGRRIRIGPEGEPWMTIVGVVGNVNHVGLDSDPDFASYEPHGKRPWSEMTVVVRTSVEPSTLAIPVQSALRATEKDILIEDVVTMTGRMQKSIAPQRLNLVLLGSFALIALLLAAVGIYAVMAQAVTQRTQEIGIRMALGAQVKDVLVLVLRNGMKLALIGVSIGLVGAFWLTRLMSRLLFGVTPTDTATFTVVAVILLGVAFLACYIPARRASKVDPLVALRYE